MEMGEPGDMHRIEYDSHIFVASWDCTAKKRCKNQVFSGHSSRCRACPSARLQQLVSKEILFQPFWQPTILDIPITKKLPCDIHFLRVYLTNSEVLCASARACELLLRYAALSDLHCTGFACRTCHCQGPHALRGLPLCARCIQFCIHVLMYTILHVVERKCGVCCWWVVMLVAAVAALAVVFMHSIMGGAQLQPLTTNPPPHATPPPLFKMAKIVGRSGPSLAPKVPEFFLAYGGGKFSFLLHVFLLQMLGILFIYLFYGKSKYVCKTRKNFLTPDLPHPAPQT